MLIYGYHIDLMDLTVKEQTELSRCPEWRSSYSVGRHQPSDGVFGIYIAGDSCLFYPLPVSSLRSQPTTSESKELQDAWNCVPEEIRLKAKNQTPEVFIFENSDD